MHLGLGKQQEVVAGNVSHDGFDVLCPLFFLFKDILTVCVHSYCMSSLDSSDPPGYWVYRSLLPFLQCSSLNSGPCEY